jgi:hypothetical protein
MQTRRDTKLESEGAEFLVLGNLLINGIPTYKTYTNMAGYDLVATNPEENRSVKIQVKSVYRTDWNGFIINNFDSDFVVFATLNRGFSKRRVGLGDGVKDPNFYVFPIEYVKEIRDEHNNWGKINKSRMKDFGQFENRWDLIKDKLKISNPSTGQYDRRIQKEDNN